MTRTRTRKMESKNIVKTVRQVEGVRRVADSVSKSSQIISETMSIKNGIAIDTKNFTLVSVPSLNDLLRNGQDEIRL